MYKPQKVVNAKYGSSQGMSEQLPKKKMASKMSGEQEPYNDDFMADGETLLREQGIIRGDCKGQIIEALPNVAATPISDPRTQSHEPYTPYPSTDKAFPRPNFVPVPTPPKSATE